MSELATERALMLADSLAYGDLIDRLHDEGLTDGLPIIPPTTARVEAMLRGRDPAMSLGPLPPLAGRADLRSLAICAVMAGCRAAEFDTLVAACEALMDPRLNLVGVSTTTGNAAIGVILHGAVAEELGANSGGNTLGPGNRVNAALGRALAFVVRSVGGATPGSIDMSTMGQPAKFGCALAEHDPPPPWQPLPRRRGFPDTAAVTVFVTAGVVEVVDVHISTGRGLLETLVAAIPLPTALAPEGGRLGGGEILALIPPEWATKLVDDGWSQDEVASFIYAQSEMPSDRLPPSLRDRATTSSLKSADSPEHVVVIVAGGVGTKATLLPSWHGGSLSVTVPVVAR